MPSPNPLRSILSVTQLEDRCNPADATYLGGAFGVNASWSTNAVPTAADRIIMDGPKSNNAGLTFPQAVGGVYGAIIIKQNYTGTVVFPEDVTFEHYHQAGGHALLIDDEVGPSRTITVRNPVPELMRSSFVWTGGDIQGEGKYHLMGVGNSFIGQDAITLHSHIEIQLDQDTWGGASPGSVGSVVVQRGTLKLHALAEIAVSNNSTLTQQKQFPASSAPVIESDPFPFGGNRGVSISSGSQFVSYGGTVPSVVNVDGQLFVKSGGLTVTGRGIAGLYGVVQNGANSYTTINNGETLKATHGVHLIDGVLATYIATAPGVSQIAVIDGRFLMEGGTVGLGVNGSIFNPIYCTLKVTGMTKLHGGMFMTKLNSNNNQERDAIDTDDQFDTTAQFQIKPIGAAPIGGTPVLVAIFAFTEDSVLPTVINTSGNTYTVAWTSGNKHLTVSYRGPISRSPAPTPTPEGEQ